MSMDIRDVIKGTNWALLREQKEILVNSPFQSKDLEYAVQGLLNWIDAIQDAVVDQGIATEEEVFGLDTVED